MEPARIMKMLRSGVLEQFAIATGTLRKDFRLGAFARAKGEELLRRFDNGRAVAEVSFRKGHRK